mgnify:CR=1 FL=1
MKYSIAQICGKHTKAQATKTTWDSIYKDVFEYSMPARDNFQKVQSGSNNDPNYQDRRSELYSSAGEQSANEFVNTMQDLLCPPLSKWIDLEAGVLFPEEKREDVNGELKKMCDIANEYKNLSNFDMAFSEFCYDLYAGTACMLIMEGDDIYTPVVYKTIPLTEYAVEEGADGKVSWVYREFTTKKENLPQMWRELRKMDLKDEDREKDIKILECTYWDIDIKKWIYLVIDLANKSEFLKREYKTNPFVVLRWNKAAGEPYGRGVGIAALNDIKTLNMIKWYSLRALAYNLPPLLVQEDAMLDVDQLDMTPFALNVVPNTQTSITPLQLTATNPNLEQYKVQELQMDIKRATLGNTLPNEGNRQLTATEVNQRMLELKKNLNSVFGRLIMFQMDTVRRIFDVMITTNIFKGDGKDGEGFDAAKINGMIYKVKINSPVAKQLKANEAQSMIASAGLLIQIDPTGASLNNTLKLAEMSPYLMDLMGVPNQFIYTTDEIRAKGEEQQKQAMAAQQAAQQGQVEAQNAIEMGKANARVAEKDATRAF